MKTIFKTIFILTLSFPVLWIAIQVIFGETYFYPKPDIDTIFSERFDEEKYNSIIAGQDSSSVVNLIGEPLSIQNLGDTAKLWYYTTDGKCGFFDFAWLGREILFTNDNKVIRLSSPIHND